MHGPALWIFRAAIVLVVMAVAVSYVRVPARLSVEGAQAVEGVVTYASPKNGGILLLVYGEGREHTQSCIAATQLCRLAQLNHGVPVKAWLQEGGPLFAARWLVRAEWRGREVLARAAQQQAYARGRLMHLIVACVAFLVGVVAFRFPPTYFRPMPPGPVDWRSR